MEAHPEAVREDRERLPDVIRERLADLASTATTTLREHLVSIWGAIPLLER